jgi:hypothetical protein
VLRGEPHCTSGRTGDTAGSPIRHRQPEPSSTMPSRTHTSRSDSAHSPRHDRAFGRAACADQASVFQDCVTMSETTVPGGRERDEHAMACKGNGGHRPAAGSRAECGRLRAGVRGPVWSALSAAGHIPRGHHAGGGRCGLAAVRRRFARGQDRERALVPRAGEPPGSRTATIYTHAMPIGARHVHLLACLRRSQSVTQASWPD